MRRGDNQASDVRGRQRQHWQTTYAAHPAMYGTAPSDPAQYAIGLFGRGGVVDLLELGAGQGRDTVWFLHAGLTVTALDYAEGALRELRHVAEANRVGAKLTTIVHDVRQPLPLSDRSVDGVYSHMLFNMALSTAELVDLAGEVHRVLRPGGLLVYTVRHTRDAHYRAGISHGDNMFENGGFIVHFFDRSLVDRLAAGFTMLDFAEFEEGELPRRLWRVTLRRDQGR
ncbi:class I SAM-dependent methyltransferase [Mycobacterium kyorinense]|uniref:6-O-methylguanine DNA methyltransferase n=1 Tax=Mycobacterium kyorinense TaxID=487514 RepID=A0A1X1XCZ9_9MYCO|nr:class I SAM-dependent methyltransferase [Mycobacterium kyorinense]ORV96692.1 6-O-methylguanine DNA methyltransferase [Mycobacterium kyorinense]